MDWSKIRNEYLNGDISYRKLAEKYKIPFNTLKDRAIREQWFRRRAERRNRIETRTEQKTVEIVSDKAVDRISRILSASDVLLAKIEEATAQLDTHTVLNRTKIKLTSTIKGVTREDVQEVSEAATVKGTIDRLGLAKLAAALKSLKDVAVAVSDGDDEGVQIIDDYR